MFDEYEYVDEHPDFIGYGEGISNEEDWGVYVNH